MHCALEVQGGDMGFIGCMGQACTSKPRRRCRKVDQKPTRQLPKSWRLSATAPACSTRADGPDAATKAKGIVPVLISRLHSLLFCKNLGLSPE